MCFVYLTQCKVKKLQRRAKKTNRCSNGSTSPHLCFHRTDIHSIRSQFRHSPPMIVHFRHSKCASLPRYGQGDKGELYIEFFHLLYVMLFFHFLRKTSQLLPERNAGKLPHYYYFSNVGLDLLSFVILSIVATAPRSIGRFPSRRIVNNNCGVTLGRCLTSASHIRPYIKKTRVHSQGICKVKIFRLMKQYARQIAGSFQTNCRV